jgi:hypothetical protein
VPFVLLACTFGLDHYATKDATGAGTVRLGNLEIDREDVAFGEQTLGSSTVEVVGVENTGQGAVHLSAALTGDAAFTLAEVGLDLAAGLDGVLTLTFQPAEIGDFAGELQLQEQGGERVSLDVSGSGVVEGGGGETGEVEEDPEGDIEVSETALAFGSLDLEDSLTMSFEVTNAGDANLLVSDATVSDSAFELGGDLDAPRDMAPGESRTVEVTFTPTTEKSYNATITLSSEDPDESKVTVALTGTGVDECEICSPFIEVDTGTSNPYVIDDFNTLLGPDTRTVTISNTGDEDLVVSGVEVNNDSIFTCGEFTLSGWSGSKTLPPSASTTFDITYTTTDACVDVTLGDENTCHIYSNDPAQPDYVISLGGVGFY